MYSAEKSNISQIEDLVLSWKEDFYLLKKKSSIFLMENYWWESLVASSIFYDQLRKTPIIIDFIIQICMYLT